MNDNDELPEQVTIDVTPMAVIALLLVIILIATSNTWVQQLLKVDLPKASTAESERKQNLTISIDVNNEFAVDDVSVNPKDLFEGVLAGLKDNTDKFVIIRADKKVTYGTIIKIMETAKKAGAKNITIATEQKSEFVKIKIKDLVKKPITNKQEKY